MAKEKKGLGTGLDILFGGNEPEEDAPGLLTLPISKVEPRADQPRTFFDEEALQDLAESIAQYGLIQPILVRKLDSGYYQIIAGERRWRAAKLAGLKEVPAVIREYTEQEIAEISLVENIQRSDLNPVEEAEAYDHLIRTYGLTQEELARRVGVTRQAVSRWELGQTEPGIETLKALAETLGAPVSMLLDLPEGAAWCQSCGMPLANADMLGTEADGSPSLKYCTYCYQGGHFTYECTMEQMVDICVEHMTYPGSGFTEQGARTHMEELLPHLERWA
mgnify:CR=1 FL=1